jgi:hypothetical protein
MYIMFLLEITSMHIKSEGNHHMQSNRLFLPAETLNWYQDIYASEEDEDGQSLTG